MKHIKFTKSSVNDKYPTCSSRELFGKDVVESDMIVSVYIKGNDGTKYKATGKTSREGRTVYFQVEWPDALTMPDVGEGNHVFYSVLWATTHLTYVMQEDPQLGLEV